MDATATREATTACAYVSLWIALSAGVILYNKYVLAVHGFPFPIALTMIHMAFCSFMAYALVKVFKVVDGCVAMTRQAYVRRVLPIAFLFAVVLWTGNSAYLYLSVSFIQMVKASMPVVVFAAAVSMRVEKYSHKMAFILANIALGVSVASWGELNFHAVGFTFLIASMAAEAFRIVSVQLLLASADIKLNSITTLYYVSPACFAFLSVPFADPASVDGKQINWEPTVLWTNAAVAFMLNVSIYLLIGKTSALTMNVAGPVKDWMLIYLSSLVFDAPITSTQARYAYAFAAVCAYNYEKFKTMKAKEATMTTGSLGGGASSVGGDPGRGGSAKSARARAYEHSAPCRKA
ncbi:Drug/Metabolite transporter superfamily [Micromonas pusilla CCMP1545]|uniref:Drug/Metabolite transporter superfamily n=1 Tax=Micromonas pusilla (strain CCMP1545) TaxID=564608 RepID=C1MV07_MICPC|nr:Drug/Metabolite transporter superfamily [Micromonas pusilla CCMP1545]EEH56725.1 Drug/Metabolite transporter superfamily [Micromonas pusilla CCMP1545]|eukprot:XP_003059593.1 Drug/Metabolite transporter superfamily [Micromonas pusilla CCMP1545]